MFGSVTTTLIIFSEKMKDIKKIVKYLIEFGLVIKGDSEAIKNEAHE